jgi:hypothetical protein
MGHSVYLVIGKDHAIGRFLKRWPGSRAVPLNGGWQAIPMEDVLYEKIEAAFPGSTRPPEFDVSPLGLESAMIEATREGGGLAYIETDYWGGSGGQSAMAVVDGEIRREPQRSRGAGVPINSALRAIDVVKSGDMDEFDTIGLGERRSMSDYAPEGPVSLMQPTARAAPDQTNGQHLPMWLVAILIAGFIVAGIAVSQFF